MGKKNVTLPCAYAPDLVCNIMPLSFYFDNSPTLMEFFSSLVKRMCVNNDIIILPQSFKESSHALTHLSCGESM